MVRFLGLGEIVTYHGLPVRDRLRLYAENFVRPIWQEKSVIAENKTSTSVARDADLIEVHDGWICCREKAGRLDWFSR